MRFFFVCFVTGQVLMDIGVVLSMYRGSVWRKRGRWEPIFLIEFPVKKMDKYNIYKLLSVHFIDLSSHILINFFIYNIYKAE